MKNFKLKNIKKERGGLLVEVMVSISVISIVTISIFNTYYLYAKATTSQVENIKTSLLMDEGVDVFRLWRDTGYGQYIATLSSSTDYYLYWTGSFWQATTTVQTNGVATRYFNISSVYRDGSDRIALSGTIDDNTKKVDIFVSKDIGFGLNTASTSFYITNLFAN